jgi:hypothetical protein
MSKKKPSRKKLISKINKFGASDVPKGKRKIYRAIEKPLKALLKELA